MAPPDPTADALGAEHRQSEGLRVVDEDKVVLAVEPRGVALHRSDIRLLVLRRQSLGIALKRIVHLLGDAKEVVLTADHAPIRNDAESAQQLRNPAAMGRRVDVQEARPA
jgi:hypothetical protein